MAPATDRPPVTCKFEELAGTAPDAAARRVIFQSVLRRLVQPRIIVQENTT